MRTFERAVDLLGPTLAAVLRVTRRVTLLVASLAVAVTACGPVAATGPPLPDPDPTEDVADPDPATDAHDSWRGDVGGPDGAPEDGYDADSPGEVDRRLTCDRAAPMAPC